jgi:GNAT superfamily N-acetyltransferase
MIQLRAATPSDLRFIHSSMFTQKWKWLVRHNYPIEYAYYVSAMDALLDALLPQCKHTVAYSPLAPDEVLGYCSSKGTECVYAYVKHIFRRQGIASALVETLDVVTFSGTMLSDGALKWAASCGLQFAPQ